MSSTPTQPFAAPYADVEANIDQYVDVIMDSLASDFMTLPKGEGFVDYAVFEEGYEALRRTSSTFSSLDVNAWTEVVCQFPIALCVMRTMLGLSPPEWAWLTTHSTDTAVTQSYIRSLDRNIRFEPTGDLPKSTQCDETVRALVVTACQLLSEGPPNVADSHIHRLEKADTMEGSTSMHAAGKLGIPYAMLLYERFLGRPFATHRDSVSEIIGDSLETAIEDILSQADVPYRKTARAESIAHLDQAPDFVVPDEFNPKVLIEAKVTQDDGTARDKVTRIQHLAQIASEHPESDVQVIACISGRGFSIRRSDMVKLLQATRGKVFTLATLDSLLECTQLAEFTPE